MAKKMSAKPKKEKGVTTVGALGMTGPSVHQKPGAPGGKVSHVKHGEPKTKGTIKASSMTVAGSMGDLGEATHHVGP